MKKTQFVKDLKEKEAVASPFLVKFSAVGTDKNGKPYMNLILMDNSGEIEARIWDALNYHVGQVVRDSFVWVEGKCQSYQGRRQIVVQKLQIVREDQVEPKEYITESVIDPAPLMAEVSKFIASIKDDHYRILAEAVFKNDETVLKLKKAPAAKSYHHAYPVGLLHHMVSVLRLLDFVAANYPKWINRDLLLMGGLFHDIGKLEELIFERITDYTSEGKLLGHLVLGAELVDRKVAELEALNSFSSPFPSEKKLLLKHLILAHHGELEFGSPKRPKLVEAMVLHYIDDLDSKINSIATFIEQDQTPGQWSIFNKNYDRFFYKPVKI